MKWHLRIAAAQRDLWQPPPGVGGVQGSRVHAVPEQGRRTAGRHANYRLPDDPDKRRVAVHCHAADLLEAEPLDAAEGARSRSSGR
ncbi:hypothetical protein GCM10017688_65260 [Streptomyces ramulosus]